jgi:murein DD-endopeptidase MepM/ murein hydrolase activator NlpD
MAIENSSVENFVRSSLVETAFKRAENAAAQASAGDAKQRQKIAQEFSSFLYLEVLKAMRAATAQDDASAGEPLSRDLYSSMMDAEVARLAAQRDRSGFAKAVERSLERVSVTPRPAREFKDSNQSLPAANNTLEPRTQAPATGVISSPFGLRADPLTGISKFYHGVDIAAPAGSPVQAAAAGRVMFSGFVAGYGNIVEIDHGSGWATRYGHNSANLVAAGDKVAAGQQIGLVGQTGRATGDHLHFEVRRDGKAVSPALFLGAEVKGTRLRSRA